MDQEGQHEHREQQGNTEQHDDAIHDLKHLLESFALFDEGWLAILLARRWDAQAGHGIVGTAQSLQSDEREEEKERAVRAGISETMKSIVRSTVVSGRATVDDWFEHLAGERGIVVGGDIREGFAEMFWKTLDVLEGDDEEDDWESVRDEDEDTHIHAEDGMDVDFSEGDPGMFHGFDDL